MEKPLMLREAIRNLLGVIVAVFVGISAMCVFICLVYLAGILVAAIFALSWIAVIMTIAVILQARRYGHGFRVVSQYDPDAADLSGSTARYGTPHDPAGLVSYTQRRPYNPNTDLPHHKPPKPLI